MTAALLFLPSFDSIADRSHNIGTACREVSRDHRRQSSLRTRLPPKTPFKPTASSNKTRSRKRLTSALFGVDDDETFLQLDIDNPSPCKKRKLSAFVAETTKSLFRSTLSSNEQQDKKLFYQNLGLIGTGSFSNVYQVQNVETQSIYALKKTNARVSISEALNEVKIVQLLQQEWKGKDEAASDVSHPHVICLMDYWITWDKRMCQLYEYYQHGTLLNLLQHNGRLNQLQILEITRQLCVGLEFVHSLGVVHLDLKPENIYVSKDFQIKIGDFGISMQTGEDAAGKSTFCSGDPIYIAPELVYSSFARDTSIVTRKADIFSLGIILSELLCDVQAPSKGQCFSNLRNDVVDFEELVAASPNARSLSSSSQSPIKSAQDELESEIVSEIDGAMKALCKRMLQSTSAHRPECAEILHSIDAILNNASNVQHFKGCVGFCALSLPSSVAVAAGVPKHNAFPGGHALRASSCPVDDSEAEPKWFHQESIKDVGQLPQQVPRASSSRRRPFKAAALRFSLEDADEDDDLHL